MYIVTIRVAGLDTKLLLAKLFFGQSFLFYEVLFVVSLHFSFYTSTKSWRGIVFIADCLCRCLSLGELNFQAKHALI